MSKIYPFGVHLSLIVDGSEVPWIREQFLPAGIIIIVLLGLFNQFPLISGIDSPSSENLIVNDRLEVISKNITVLSSIQIENGGTLILVNSTLTVGNGENATCSIHCEQNGTLQLVNSTLAIVSGYYMEIHGTVLMDNSIVVSSKTRPAVTDTHANEMRFLSATSSFNRIQFNRVNLVLDGGKSDFRGCEFNISPLHIMNQSSPILSDNTFLGSETREFYTIKLGWSAPFFSNNSLINMSTISFEHCMNPSIIDNMLVNTTIQYVYCSGIQCYNNRLKNSRNEFIDSVCDFLSNGLDNSTLVITRSNVSIRNNEFRYTNDNSRIWMMNTVNVAFSHNIILTNRSQSPFIHSDGGRNVTIWNNSFKLNGTEMNGTRDIIIGEILAVVYIIVIDPDTGEQMYNPNFSFIVTSHYKEYDSREEFWEEIPRHIILLDGSVLDIDDWNATVSDGSRQKTIRLNFTSYAQTFKVNLYEKEKPPNSGWIDVIVEPVNLLVIGVIIFVPLVIIICAYFRQAKR